MNSENYFSLLKDFTTYPKKTNVSCWWCCHTFETKPIGIPCKQDSTGFHVIGCFCSFNCAYSFLKQPDYSLLRSFTKMPNGMDLLHMYNSLTGEKNITMDNFFLPAPPKYVLQKFGGSLTIEDYRRNFAYNCSTINIISTPMVPWGLIAEEIRFKGRILDSNGKALEIRLAKSKSESSKPKSDKKGKKAINTIISYVPKEA